jgi:hypothetical protein
MDIHTEGDIEPVSSKVQVFGQAVDSRIADVGSVDECTQPNAKQPWKNMVVALSENAVLDFGIVVVHVLSLRFGSIGILLVRDIVPLGCFLWLGLVHDGAGGENTSTKL